MSIVPFKRLKPAQARINALMREIVMHATAEPIEINGRELLEMLVRNNIVSIEEDGFVLIHPEIKRLVDF